MIPEDSVEDSYDTHHAALTTVLDALRDKLADDYTLTSIQHQSANQFVFTATGAILEATEQLPEWATEDELEETPPVEVEDTYEAAITQLERHLCWLITAIERDQPAPCYFDEPPAAKLTTALEYITALRGCLPDVTPDSPILADYEMSLDEIDAHVEGRGDNDGRWLEYQLQRALDRWGYRAETRQYLFSVEVDVVARQAPYQHEPSDWLVAQCKDWTDDPITPAALFRLCTVAFACRAMPILCHTTELTPRTEQLAREFEVRVLDLKDLERAELPAPQIAKPTLELNEWHSRYNARTERGSLPFLFDYQPGKRFSYVPGFKPVGRDADYEPIDDDEDVDDDSHPAAGH